jgi:predicted transcriptional regulator
MAPPALHELEAEVMDAVWDLGEASVRQVMDALNPAAAKPRAYTTYMTILGRLHTKGLLDRRREGKTDYYRPVYTRPEYADLRAQAEVAALVDAYGDVALGHFARQVADLDPKRRRALERLARAR